MKEPKLSMPTTYTDEMTKNELRKELEQNPIRLHRSLRR